MNISGIYQLYLNFPKITTDTRKELHESIFIALKGEKFDANKFVFQALEQGAAYVISDDISIAPTDKIIKVNNCLETLQQLAAFHRSKLTIPVLAITGSNGKTTTKELIYHVLAKKYKTFATSGNLNNHIGLPLSLLSIKPDHEIAVLELGANHQGENKLLTEICQPSIGLTTNIGKDHMGEFGGIKGIIAAYKEFTDYFDQSEKIFFHNTDDRYLCELLSKKSEFGFGSNISDCEMHVSGMQITNSVKLMAKIQIKRPGKLKDEFKIKSNFFGSFNLMNILAAILAGTYFKLEIASMVQAIESYVPQNNRSQLLKFGTNQIILDAYNANPSSMSLALNDFNKINHVQKIVLLGDMHELGEYAHEEHQLIINQLKNTNFTKIILVGNEFGKLKDQLDCLHFDEVDQLNKWMHQQNFKNTFFLVKGSRSEKLEKAFLNLF